MKINLIQYHQPGKSVEIKVTKSNTNGAYELPYQMTSYTPLLTYLNTFVPPEWQQQLQDLLKQEQDLITKRRNLLTNYRNKIVPILERESLAFKQLYPEYFI